MPAHREHLPQTGGDRLFLTDGGIETTLIFHDGLDLPHFAAFDLLKDEAGTNALRRYFERYADVAERHGTGLVLESATWRASADWAELLGYSTTELAEANRRAIELLARIRDERAGRLDSIVISGCVGPRGDGYTIDNAMTAEEAEAYHAEQIGTFAGTEADMVTAITMTYVAEAIGVARAARAAGMPVAISFTVETDGRLPSGEPLDQAIARVDAATDGYPAYYMINCAHPTHFDHVLEAGAGWLSRIGGIRANASRMSHEELDEAPELDAGDPVELSEQYAELMRVLPALTVLGGCCGTDHTHVDRIGAACAGLGTAGIAAD